MKLKRRQIYIIFSITFIGILIITSSTKIVDNQAAVESDNLEIDINHDFSTWRETLTEVVSTESTSGSYNPSLAVDSTGNIHIAWWDYTNYALSGTDADIFYKRWNASSSLWTTTEVVSTESTGGSYYPSLAVDIAGNVYIAWEDLTDYNSAGSDRDIFYKYWDASSSSWTTTEVVSTESTADSSFSSLAVEATGNVHIAWEDDTNYALSGTDSDIFYKRWNASSSSWTITEIVSTESTGNSYSPSLTVDAVGNVHIAWEDSTNIALSGTDTDIFYKCWDASTSSWKGTEVVSTESTSGSYNPSLAVDSTGNIHIAWDDYTDYASAGTDQDIFYKYWDALASVWACSEVVSTESIGGSAEASLAVDAVGNVHIAWQDYSQFAGMADDYSVFYKHRKSSSLWTTTEVVSTESPILNTLNPSLMVDTSGYVHVAWDDYTNYAGAGSDTDIFYKRAIGPPMTPELASIVPNPLNLLSVTLDWDSIFGAATYYVYRSTSYIWSVEGLLPIASTSVNHYLDTPPAEDFYYYVVVAGNEAGNSTYSNCQYVEVKLTALAAPELAFIFPNPSDSANVFLDWNDITGAVEYFIYRSNSFIWSVDSLTPIGTTDTSSYSDLLPLEGYFYYVVVASDSFENSTISNCVSIHYEIPHLREFTLVTSLLIGATVISLIVIRRRKSK